jgi:sugar phosphate isomerase/epimerase
MKVTGIAINADAARLNGDLNSLRSSLDYFGELGFSHIEIAPHGAGVIYNGNLNKHRMRTLLDNLTEYDFKYTVHGVNSLNLMNQKAGNVERQAFLSSLEFAAALGSPVMVYHAGRYTPEENFLLPERTKLTPSDIKDMWNLERSSLQEMARIADQLGLTIGVETARPYLDASPYCYAEFLSELVRMVEEVNHPRVGITLDMGHTYLAANHHGYDLLGGIKLMASYVKHIHLHDNFGKPSASYERKMTEMAAMGRGDMHMPIGWGTVPASDILACLPDYVGVVTLELRSRYINYADEALQNACSLLKAVEQVA